LYREFEALGHWRYSTFNEQRGANDTDAIPALLRDIEEKRRIILRLHRRQRWDLFFVHLQASDTVCHHFWPGWDRNSPRARGCEPNDAIPQVYRALDRLIGELVEGHRGRVLLVSDHGFGGASDVAVYLNRVLAELGLLSFRPPGPLARLSGVASAWAAASLPPSWLGRLMQTLPKSWTGVMMSQARQPSVDFAGSDAFSDELDYAPSIWLRRPLNSEQFQRLEHALLSLRDPRNQRPLVAALHRRQGAGKGPDLYVEPAWIDGYRTTFAPSAGAGPSVDIIPHEKLSVGRGFGMSGVHHPAGVVAVWGDGIAPGRIECGLPEIGASIPALMGLPGRKHAKRAEPALALALGLTSADAGASRSSRRRELPISSASIARLQALGYL
ncbi:MAG: alkaline phosphatase family protein, partial [Myxococcota bacterium]